jgi:hypothetical protein
VGVIERFDRAIAGLGLAPGTRLVVGPVASEEAS